MNVMLASVTERTREIGVRLAIGASDAAVQIQFLAEAVMLCLLGGAIGVIVSVAGSSFIARALAWPLAIPAHGLMLAVLFSVGVEIVFGFIPARRAARLAPIAAVHDE
jgi:putative ABC transport system permease protein